MDASDTARFSALKVFQRTLIGIVVAHIDLGCGNAVAEHLGDVSQRHLNGANNLINGRVIRPVFKVMAVSALVVHPCVGVALDLTLAVVGTAGALPVFRALNSVGEYFDRSCLNPCHKIPARLQLRMTS